MKLSKLAAIAVAVLLLTSGLAVAGAGNAPDHAGEEDAKNEQPDHADEQRANDSDDDRSDARDENATDGQERPPDDPGNESAAGDADERGGGPAVDLSAHVPDHVQQIHETIRQFLAGELDILGEHLSAVASDGAEEGDDADRANADAGDQATDDDEDETEEDGDAADADA
jgi:hypothetical protein